MHIIRMSNHRDKFKGKYQIGSNRLKGWDYGEVASYFITICTKNRTPWLGEVQYSQAILSTAGLITKECIEKIHDIFKDTNLVGYVIMPNHIHAIISIVERHGVDVETPQWDVSTKDPWKPGTLGVIINQYKSTCTKRIRAAGYSNFSWQPSYYDHIIRSENEQKKIYDYIRGNPDQWSDDKYYSVDKSKH